MTARTHFNRLYPSSVQRLPAFPPYLTLRHHMVFPHYLYYVLLLFFSLFDCTPTSWPFSLFLKLNGHAHASGPFCTFSSLCLNALSPNISAAPTLPFSHLSSLYSKVTFSEAFPGLATYNLSLNPLLLLETLFLIRVFIFLLANLTFFPLSLYQSSAEKQYQ